ncbi:glycosyltransferase family 2 protein [Phascolarctobacterium sp.]|uniref:glycosyltransferase family 2 protein n=1 Tax=Phascolarctobacterium sp. TaxID=2049039 RepID=UPI003865186D
MVNVSVLILARNEEKNIGDCIKSCSFANDILIIDDGSTDKTKEIAESLGARVIHRNMNGDWGAQQTFAIQRAKYPWIFFIDADERCTTELGKEISAAVEKDEKVAYWIKRKNKFHNNSATHGSLRPDYVCRLMPAEGSYVEGEVHPAIITPYKDGKLKGHMYHFTYDNWEQYLNKLNKYTTLAAEKYKNKGKKVSFFGDVVARPVLSFFKTYIVDMGILDGKIGFIFAINHAYYTMLKYVKLYYLYKDNGKL